LEYLNLFKVKSPVLSNGKIENEVYLLKIHSPQISKICVPGQFCNIKVSDSDFPLLRRPFSICDVEGENLYFMFDIQGEGTKLLSERKSGTHLDILGPLGNSKVVITYKMINPFISTDDGSDGYKGTVVDLLKKEFINFEKKKVKIFSCGPNPMLSSLRTFCIEEGINCEASTECAMACGFGICQGCPIESSDDGVYKLVCKDGPVFNLRDIVI
jgi:dihydroorotate dehydrogenase electron transfer subunit